MSVNIKKIIEIINKIAPEELQESWDNSGVQICDSKEKGIGRILTCLEISDSIVDEAINRNADMIVTHHPLFFGSFKAVDAGDVVGSQVIRLIRAGISVYSAHTSFDSAENGTNRYLADRLGLQEIVPMIASELYSGCGMGRAGVYKEPLSYASFEDRLCGVCRYGIRIAGNVPERVSRVALCTGSGAEFTDLAKSMSADVYITGDVKYHDARHAADIGMCVIDAGHYGTEVMFGENMAAQLEERLEGRAEVMIAETDIYPFVTIQRSILHGEY